MPFVSFILFRVVLWKMSRFCGTFFDDRSLGRGGGRVETDLRDD